MSFDLSQFKQVYIEESLENIETMESELVAFDVEDFDLETINTIFRAAHSIKGGAATFEFTELAAFTHEVETLLDELRSEQRAVTVAIIDCLLKSTDCIKMMVDSYINETAIDQEQIDENLAVVRSILGSDEEASTSATLGAESLSQTAEGLWEIIFKPAPHILFTGNEPLRLFRELEHYGQVTAKAFIDELPSFDKLNPENCYLNWLLTLKADVDVDYEGIKEVFDWVLDDCELEIKPISSQTQESIVPTETEESTTTGTQVTAEQSSQPVATAAASTSTAKATTKAVKAEKSQSGQTSIRVDIEKVDSLINLVGELVITQSMLSELGTDFNMAKLESLQNGLGQLLQNTKELQESVMRIRMLPISNAFNRFPRMVRDLEMSLKKKIKLLVSGEQTELDKTVMEQITDPLVHLVRNSVDHGIESPEERLAKGKSEHGTIKLNAYHEGGNIVIEISDDGAGLNSEKIHALAIERGIVSKDTNLSEQEIFELIFSPGFSTADKVTDVSGRGVGMDVVKSNITSVGGVIEIESKRNQGTMIRVRLPLTLAIVDGQLIKVGEETYVIPLISIIESLQIKSSQLRKVSGSVELYRLRDENVPILRVYKEFGIENANTDLNNAMLVVVEGYGMKVGLLVDDLLAQQQVVIKSLETNYHKVDGISGATILGDGKVALIIDVADIIRKSMRKHKRFDQGQAA